MYMLIKLMMSLKDSRTHTASHSVCHHITKHLFLLLCIVPDKFFSQLLFDLSNDASVLSYVTLSSRSFSSYPPCETK